MNASLALAEIDVDNNNTKFDLSLWVRNMWDVSYVYRRDNANAATLGFYGNFNAPRTFGISASVKL